MAYAKIVDGALVYATINNGALIADGKRISCPKSSYPKYGYYPVSNVMEDGTPYLDEENNTIINPIGAPKVQSELEAKIASINGQLADTDPLIKALERLIAANGATEEDKQMAADRIALRDELGKVVQTDDGDGTPMNPYKWVDGADVVKDMWYRTPNYIWQAIKDGTPSSETDTEYFDVVGLD